MIPADPAARPKAIERERRLQYSAAMLRKTLALAGVSLVLFHAWLFAGQAWGGELADLALVGRWAVAGGLLWALWRLGRQGASLFRGRKAVAIWLLAAMLHGPAVAERMDAPGIPALPEVAATLTQLVLGAAFGTALLLLVAIGAARRRPMRRFPPIAAAEAAFRPLPPGSFLVVAPRPPPLA
jgi:hypothetical protein